MALNTTGTILTIKDAGNDLLPLYSAVGLRQTVDYIDGSLLQARTVNGELVNLSLARFRKLRTVISAKHIRPPSIDLIYPGRIVTVECATIFSYATSGGTPGRSVVSGSTFTEGNFTFYRPSITCMIGKPSVAFDEWEADHEWSIPMEEV